MAVTIAHLKTSLVADGSDTSLVRPSDWNATHVIAGLGNAAEYNVGTNNTNVLVRSDANGLYAGQGFSGTNISGTVNSNGISLSVAPGGGAGDGYNLIAAGGSTANSTGTIVFSNSNGVSFGLNGSVVTASHNGLTTARASTDAIGLNTAGSNITWTANSSGLSIDARGYAGTGTTFNGTNVNGSITQNSNGIRLDLSVSPGGAGDGGNIIAAGGSTANSTGTVVFSNSNNVSFGLNGATVTASASFAQSADTNKAGTGFTTTSTAGIVIAGTNDANGLKLAVPAYLTTAQPVGAYLTTARASNDAVGLNTAQSNVTWTVNSDGLSFDARGYAGTGTTFAGANLSASMTVNSNGVNLSMSAANPGGAAGNTVSYFQNYPYISLATHPVSNTTQAVIPVTPQINVSANFARLGRVMSWSSTSAATTANTTFSWGIFETVQLGLCSRGTGASSNSYMLISSSTYGSTMSGQVQANANGSQYTLAHGFTVPIRNGTSSFSTSVGISNASIQFSTTQFTATSLGLSNGTHLIDYQFAMSMTPGDYVLLCRLSSTSSTQGLNVASNCRFSTNAHLGVVQVNQQFDMLGMIYGTSFSQPMVGGDIRNTSTGLNDFAISDVRSMQNNILLPVVFRANGI